MKIIKAGSSTDEPYLILDDKNNYFAKTYSLYNAKRIANLDKLLEIDKNDINLLVMALDQIRSDKEMSLSHGTASDIQKRLFDILDKLNS